MTRARVYKAHIYPAYIPYIAFLVGKDGEFTINQ